MELKPEWSYNNDIVDEIDALLQCKNLAMENILTKFINQLTSISIQFANLADTSKLCYMLNSSDPLFTPIVGIWLYGISQLYNKLYNK